MPKEIVIPYKPTPKQVAFHTSPTKETLFGGAVGGGKTCAIALEAIIRGLQFNMDIVMGRAQLTDFLSTTYVELRKWLPQEIIEKEHRSHPMHITLKANPNAINARKRIIDGKTYDGRMEGTVIRILPLDDPERLKSHNLGLVLGDEVSGIPEEVHNMAISRTREPSMHYSEHKIKYASNPVASWVKTRYITMPLTPAEAGCNLTPDPYHISKTQHCVHCKYGGCQTGKNISYIPSFIDDNPFLPVNYKATLYSAYPKALADMLIEGSWELLGGAVFPEFAIVKYETPFPIPADWTRFMAIDPHIRTPTHVLWTAVAPSGQIYVYRELVMSDSVQNICKMIKHHEQGEHIFFRIIDTAANTDDTLTGLNIMDEFSKNGISCTGAAKGNFVGYTRIKDMLAKNRLSVFSTCPIFYYQMKHLEWDEYAAKTTNLRKEQIQSWKKKDDHLFDCFKYIAICNPKYVLPGAWKQEVVNYNNELYTALNQLNIRS